jgi:molybdate transport system ATP-binding protein
VPELSVAVRVDRRGGPGPGAGPGGGFSLDVELMVPPGITCVLGRSGSGKSTLLGAVSGLVRPTRGRIAFGDEVWFDAERGLEVPARDRQIAYVFQGLALFPHFDGIGNVTYGMPRDAPRAERRERARALLKRLEVGHLAHRKPRTYSGGEAQRVALARALARAPKVVLLDEPFSALDRDLRLQLARLVRTLVDEEGLPVMFVTHNVGEARALGDQVVLIDAGRIVARGTPAEVLPRSAGTRSRVVDDGVEGEGQVEGEIDEVDLDGTPMPELVRR